MLDERAAPVLDERVTSTHDGRVTLLRRMLPHLLALGAIAGCSDLAAVSRELGRPLPPGSAPVLAKPAESPRATTDQPDESSGFQSHVVYFLPADAPDERLDTNGGLADVLAQAQAWMAGQTGGRHLRLDTVGGRPDISFFRSVHSDRELGNSTSELRDAIQRELEGAGFDNPLKLYCAFYAGSAVDRADPTTTGKSSGGYAAVFFKQCNPCTPTPRVSRTPLAIGLTFLHESLHGLGFVPDCAPHHDGSHVSDDENDLMSASGESEYLDRGHDDYFMTGRSDCPDLADSPFLEPLPDHVVAPTDRPLALDPGKDAVTIPLPPASPRDRLVLDALTVGAGPFGTYTLAITAHAAVPGTPTRGHVARDGTRYGTAFRLRGDAPTTFYASVPRAGTHKVTLGVPTDDKGTEVHDHTLEVDGDAPPSKAVLVDP